MVPGGAKVISVRVRVRVRVRPSSSDLRPLIITKLAHQTHTVTDRHQRSPKPGRADPEAANPQAQPDTDPVTPFRWTETNANMWGGTKPVVEVSIGLRVRVRVRVRVTHHTRAGDPSHPPHSSC